ncbi:hypothetical protein JCM10212_004176 [Sporobolomyces blumeae]
MGSPSPARELILAVFVHGFKGGADTFADFPQRLQAILTPCGIEFVPVVYPPFDTRGELKVAVDNHITWLTTLTAEKTAEYREQGGKGPVRILLFGHSMGGLVISDVLLSTLSSASLPILGLIAYDSPLLGLNPAVFKSTFDKAIDYGSKGQAALAALGAGYGFFKNATGGGGGGSSGSRDTPNANQAKPSGSKSNSNQVASKEGSASSPSSTTANKSGWGSLPILAIAGGAAAAAIGAGWYHRDKLAEHWSWATSHLSFVGELWKVSELEQRLDRVVEAKEKGVGFHCFYTSLPSPSPLPPRTFLILPSSSSPVAKHFTPATNTRSSDEVMAHVDMFDKSDGVYELGRETARLVAEWVDKSRKGEMGYWTGAPAGKSATSGAVGGDGEKGQARA